jgi:NADPH:quinone reductase-like Zn-dependent oxidoreductase
MSAALVPGPEGPENVSVREITTPERERDQFLVRVRAASVNPFDWIAV